jgi:hypothetical protein
MDGRFSGLFVLAGLLATLWFLLRKRRGPQKFDSTVPPPDPNVKFYDSGIDAGPGANGGGNVY